MGHPVYIICIYTYESGNSPAEISSRSRAAKRKTRKEDTVALLRPFSRVTKLVSSLRPQSKPRKSIWERKNAMMENGPFLAPVFPAMQLLPFVLFVSNFLTFARTTSSNSLGLSSLLKVFSFLIPLSSLWWL